MLSLVATQVTDTNTDPDYVWIVDSDMVISLVQDVTMALVGSAGH